MDMSDSRTTKIPAYRSAGDFIRDLGDRALKHMTREELIEAAFALDTVEAMAHSLCRLADGLGSLISVDAAGGRKGLGRSGALQGEDSMAAFNAIAEGIDAIAAVTYVSGYAMSKLLRPEIYGHPVQAAEVAHE